VVNEHRATEVEVGDTEAAPDGGQRKLASAGSSCWRRSDGGCLDRRSPASVEGPESCARTRQGPRVGWPDRKMAGTARRWWGSWRTGGNDARCQPSLGTVFMAGGGSRRRSCSMWIRSTRGRIPWARVAASPAQSRGARRAANGGRQGKMAMAKQRNGEGKQWEEKISVSHCERIRARRHRHCSDGVGTVLAGSGGDGAVRVSHVKRCTLGRVR
jgi:hypothetical protein